MLRYRAEASFDVAIERAKQIIWQRLVKFLRDLEGSLRQPDWAGSTRRIGTCSQLRDRLVLLYHLNDLTLSHLLKIPRQIGLDLGNGRANHASYYRSVGMEVKPENVGALP